MLISHVFCSHDQTHRAVAAGHHSPTLPRRPVKLPYKTDLIHLSVDRQIGPAGRRPDSDGRTAGEAIFCTASQTNRWSVMVNEHW